MTRPIRSPRRLRMPFVPPTFLTIVALTAVWATVLVEALFWVWGVVFAMWAITGIVSGETFLVTKLRRRNQPVLFWLVSLTWLTIGVLWALFPT